MFTIIRIILLVIVSVCVVWIIKKSKCKFKKVFSNLTVALCIVLVSISSMFPVENLFLSYQSPEKVFNYVKSGQIYNIIYGRESSLVIYNTGNSTYSYYIIPKTSDGYKIPNYFTQKKISHKFNKQGAFEVYNVKGTQDYYVSCTVNLTDISEDILVFNSENEKIESKVINIKYTNFVFLWMPEFSDGCYLMINDEKIVLSA